MTDCRDLFLEHVRGETSIYVLFPDNLVVRTLATAEHDPLSVAKAALRCIPHKNTSEPQERKAEGKDFYFCVNSDEKHVARIYTGNSTLPTHPYSRVILDLAKAIESKDEQSNLTPEERKLKQTISDARLGPREESVLFEKANDIISATADVYFQDKNVNVQGNVIIVTPRQAAPTNE